MAPSHAFILLMRISPAFTKCGFSQVMSPPSRIPLWNVPRPNERTETCGYCLVESINAGRRINGATSPSRRLGASLESCRNNEESIALHCVAMATLACRASAILAARASIRDTICLWSFSGAGSAGNETWLPSCRFLTIFRNSAMARCTSIEGMGSEILSSFWPFTLGWADPSFSSTICPQYASHWKKA